MQYRSTIQPAARLCLAGVFGFVLSGWGCGGFEGSIDGPQPSSDAPAAVSGGTRSDGLSSWDAGSSGRVLTATGDLGQLDPDSDGLSNAVELTYGSDPNLADTDRDGVGDLAESVAGTDPTDSSANPMARGDFYFLTAFGATPTPERETLLFATTLRSADLFILVDTTASMQPVLSVLQERLSTRIVPEAGRAIADLRVGVGAFQDLPTAPYGDPGDVVFAVTQAPTLDTKQVQAGVNALKLGSGGDGPEAAIPALYALATGEALGTLIPPAPACAHGGTGYACFRSGAVPIVLLVSDAEFHNGPQAENVYMNVSPLPANYASALAALRAIHARVISIHVASESSSAALASASPKGATPSPGAAVDHMRALSRDTGAVGADGQPLFFGVDADATGLDARVVDAVRAVAEQVPISVSALLRDDPSDDQDATQLIERIEAHTASGGADAERCASGLATRDRDGDGVPDTFASVRPGTPVCFDVWPRKNTRLRSGARPAVYRAFIDLVADDMTTLDTRSVYLLVPPAAPVLL
jgi:hypothetical protein